MTIYKGMIDPDDDEKTTDKSKAKKRNRRKRDIPEPEGWRPFGYEW
ncbi:MAG: hypothetical protein IKP11_05735 [Paludibacteraceae bacterium]|nr:hypothetical protein [Paludibacteraceae bacterium]